MLLTTVLGHPLFFILILRAAHALVQSMDESSCFTNNSADYTIPILKIILEDKYELEAKKQENFEVRACLISELILIPFAIIFLSLFLSLSFPFYPSEKLYTSEYSNFSFWW